MTSRDLARQQLATAMNRRRAALNIKWDDVARRGGISTATLRRARNGDGDETLTIDTIAAIERGLSWEEGTVEAMLTGAPVPQASAPIPPVPPGFDPKLWQSYDDVGRQAILDGIRIADRRRTRNPSSEGERTRTG
jgi:hypothetical protein